MDGERWTGPQTMLKARLQRLLSSSLQYARVRLELLELELGEERERIGMMMTRGLVLSLAALMTVQFFGLLVIALSWNTPWRVHAIVALGAVAIATTLSAWRALRRLKRAPSRPLANALRELDKIVEQPTAQEAS